MLEVDLAALLLRVTVGGTMIAHGWNHAFGGGKLPGTARWFESIGIRPGRVHALLATLTELGAGRFSLDHVLGIGLDGAAGLAVAAGLGALGAALLLGLFWRPDRGEAAEEKA